MTDATAPPKRSRMLPEGWCRRHRVEALGLFRETGDMERVAWTLQCLGYLAIDQRDVTGAAAPLRDAFRLRRTQRHLPGLAIVLDGIAILSVWSAQHDIARALFAAADDLRAASGVQVAIDEPAVIDARRVVGPLSGETDLVSSEVDAILGDVDRLVATVVTPD